MRKALVLLFALSLFINVHYSWSLDKQEGRATYYKYVTKSYTIDNSYIDKIAIITRDEMDGVISKQEADIEARSSKEEEIAALDNMKNGIISKYGVSEVEYDKIIKEFSKAKLSAREKEIHNEIKRQASELDFFGILPAELDKKKVHIYKEAAKKYDLSYAVIEKICSKGSWDEAGF